MASRILKNAVLPTAAVAVALGMALGPSHFLVDDSYISFRYAGHLAVGDGLVYNAGERVEGYTNFLWVLALAAARVAGFAIPSASQVLGVLAGIGALIATFGLGRQLLPGRHLLLQGAPALFLAFDRSFWFWAMSGMETCLFTMLVTLGMVLFWSGSSRRDLFAALALFGAALTRPEGVAVFGLLIAQRVAIPGERSRRTVLAPLCLFSILLACYLVWKTWYFGEVIPNTFYAKAVGDSGLAGWGARYLRDFLVNYSPLVALSLAALAWPPAGLSRQRALLSGAVAVFYAGYVAAVGGDIYYHYRFLMPVLPLLCGLAAAALARVADALAGRRRFLQVAIPVALALLARGTTLFLTEERFRGWAAADRKDNRERELIAGFLKTNFPPSTVIATVAAGIIPYLTDFPTVDMLGLTNREIGRAPVQKVSGELLAHQKSSASYVLGKRPELIEFGIYRGAVPREVGAGGWPLDFALFAGPFYQGDTEYPARVDLVLSAEFHRNYTFMLYRVNDTLSFVTCRRLPEGTIAESKALANLAWAQYSLGLRDEALSTLERARALAPADSAIRQRLELVKSRTSR